MGSIFYFLPVVTLSVPTLESLLARKPLLLEVMVAEQRYTPELLLPNDLTVTILVCNVLLPIAPLDILNPAGPDHTVFTVTGTSTAALNSTLQVRVMSDPTGRMGLTELLATVTNVGAGTVR